MSYRINVLAASLATISLTSGGWGQNLSCPNEDATCRQTSFEQLCTGAPSSAARCSEWLHALEQSAVAGQVEVKLLAGAANVALADASEEGQRKEAYYNRAAELYRDVLVQEPRNIDALTGLATVARSTQERIAFLRQRLELDPNNIFSLEFLAHALTNSGEQGAVAEAAALNERIYELLPPSEKKWQAAAVAAFEYEWAELASRAQEVRSRASADFGLPQVSAELARPELLAADRLRTQLTSVCTLPVMYIIAAETCLSGLKAASDETRRSQQPFVVAQLVAGVSAAIAATAQYEGLLRNANPNWRSNFEETLQDFLLRGISTVETFSAYAAVKR